jgi:threonine dehydratase
VINQHGHADFAGRFIHPVASQDVLAGNATIGMEIFEDLPDVDTVLVPFGGGGLCCGIASALRALNPKVKVIACESEHCAPLTAAIAMDKPVQLPCPASFISGIGIGRVLDEMWPLVKDLVHGAAVVGVEDISKTIRMLLERHRVLAEGAGAASVAAAPAGKGGMGKVVCVISGGNLDNKYLQDVWQGEHPRRSECAKMQRCLLLRFWMTILPTCSDRPDSFQGSRRSGYIEAFVNSGRSAAAFHAHFNQLVK